jgi:hypothetical protein
MHLKPSEQPEPPQQSSSKAAILMGSMAMFVTKIAAITIMMKTVQVIATAVQGTTTGPQRQSGTALHLLCTLPSAPSILAGYWRLRCRQHGRES